MKVIQIVLLFLLAWSTVANGKDGQNIDWPTYQGDDSRNQYSELSQITPENADMLEVAWIYSSGENDQKRQIQCNPLIIDGVLYGLTPLQNLFALDAATGEELWQFDPAKLIGEKLSLNHNRGMSYWVDGSNERIFFSAGSYYFAVDPETGDSIKEFGGRGYISLYDGIPEWASDLFVVSTTPGVIYKNRLIIGTRVSEGQSAAPGYIRAFDTRTGRLLWTFKTIPHPGELGYDTWPPEAYKSVGGANSWSGMSLDRERGIVYVPTGSASFDFYGGNRHGQNLFANCLIALDAFSGEYIWHYQFVHHDLWDRDLPAPPNLVTLERDGKRIDAVAQITKSAHIFIFDRETGEPLFPIEERPVNTETNLEGEKVWPTQPFPLKPQPFGRQALTLDNITKRTEEAHNYVARILETVRTGEQFLPPSLQGTIIFPGFDGGGEWGGASFDQETGILYVNGSEMPWLLTMIDTRTMDRREPAARTYMNYCAMCHGPDMEGNEIGGYPSLLGIEERFSLEEIHEVIQNGRNMMPAFSHLEDKSIEDVITFINKFSLSASAQNKDAVSRQDAEADSNNGSLLPYTYAGYNRFLDPDGYPAVEPPWGQLNAIDLNKGEIVWQVPLGEYEELSAQGIPKTGRENYGGPVATAGGVIFIAASSDQYFRVFNKQTGEELAKYKLPAGGYATPSVYSVKGKQYVVIACGGGKMNTPYGNYYVSFALPDS